jgi:hypothetical protein
VEGVDGPRYENIQAALLFIGGGKQCQEARCPHISPA